MAASALIGDDVRVAFSFTALGTTTLTDPPGVQVVVRNPDLSEDVYEYPADTQIEKTGVGSYTITLRMTASRRTVVRPVGTGVINKSQEIYIDVAESFFAEPLP